MQRVEKEIARLIQEIDYDEVTRLFDKLCGGKRLRAKLILKIAPQSEKAPLLAAIVELIHAASLLHDDVIDEATLRRGEVSVNATEGSKIAVMLGDILYSKAFSELVFFEREISKAIALSVTALSKGEMLDVQMARSFNDDAAAYLDMLYLKTATLIEAAAYSAAILAGKEADIYALYGKNLGLSFQIVDDILDITSDKATLGKPAMNDFAEGKCTLPYIYLYQALDEQEKKKLLELHGRKATSKEIEWMLLKMKEHQSIKRSFVLARKLSDEAMNALEDEKELIEILETMIKRSY